MQLTAEILHHTTLSIDSLKALSYHNARRLDAVQAERIGFVLRFLFYRRKIMSKYEPLWDWVGRQAAKNLTLTFAELQQILGFPIDHSFLNYKKELLAYGYRVGKISMKKQTVDFQKASNFTHKSCQIVK